MLAPYRPLFAVPGALRFILGAALGRLATAMFGISTVVMVATRHDSYGLAGSVSAVGLFVLAVTAPVIGGLIDRRGQRRVSIPLVAFSTSMLTVTVLFSVLDAPVWCLFVFYPLSAMTPSLGTMTRARWSHVYAGDEATLHVAMSFEQVVDELSFVVAPVLAVIVSTVILPEAGLILAGICFLAGTLLFCSARSSEPPVVAHEHRPTGIALGRPGLLIVGLVMTMTGVIFGGNEVVTLAVADAAGNKEFSSVMLALYALGSAAAGLVFGVRTFRGSIVTRLVIGTGVMFLLEAPLLLFTSLWPLAVVMALAGLATAPTLITSMGLAQRLVPAAMLNEGMTIVLTGLLIGVSAGSALAGGAVEHWGAHTAYAVPVSAGLLAVLIALVGWRRLARADGQRLAGNDSITP